MYFKSFSLTKSVVTSALSPKVSISALSILLSRISVEEPSTGEPDMVRILVKLGSFQFLQLDVSLENSGLEVPLLLGYFL